MFCRHWHWLANYHCPKSQVRKLRQKEIETYIQDFLSHLQGESSRQSFCVDRQEEWGLCCLQHQEMLLRGEDEKEG